MIPKIKKKWEEINNLFLTSNLLKYYNPLISFIALIAYKCLFIN
jgi:hypothetical protein